MGSVSLENMNRDDMEDKLEQLEADLSAMEQRHAAEKAELEDEIDDLHDAIDKAVFGGA
jgi:ABC-type phosphate transport system auxiliary subunit